MTAAGLAGFNDLPGSYWFLLAPPPRENRLTQVVSGTLTASYVYDGKLAPSLCSGQALSTVEEATACGGSSRPAAR